MKIRGPFVSAQLSGSLGGVVAAHGPFGPYLRARSIPVNPNSPRQVSIRTAMGVNSSRWTNILTPAERLGWEEYAQGTPITDSFGDDIILPGRNMYLRANNFRTSIGIPQVDTAPATPGVGIPCALTLFGDTTDGIQIQSALPALAAGDLCGVRLGIPVNQSKNFYDSPFTFVAGLGVATVFPVTIKPAAEVFVGQRYNIRNRFFEANGKVSNEVTDVIDIVA